MDNRSYHANLVATKWRSAARRPVASTSLLLSSCRATERDCGVARGNISFFHVVPSLRECEEINSASQAAPSKHLSPRINVGLIAVCFRSNDAKNRDMML